MPDNLTQISTTERQIQAVKFKLKDLKSSRWTGTDLKKPKDLKPEIQRLETELVDKRKTLAKLIVEQYSIKL